MAAWAQRSEEGLAEEGRLCAALGGAFAGAGDLEEGGCASAGAPAAAAAAGPARLVGLTLSLCRSAARCLIEEAAEALTRAAFRLSAGFEEEREVREGRRRREERRRLRQDAQDAQEAREAREAQGGRRSRAADPELGLPLGRGASL